MNKEVKVTQLCGFIGKKAAYHHGKSVLFSKMHLFLNYFSIQLFGALIV